MKKLSEEQKEFYAYYRECSRTLELLAQKANKSERKVGFFMSSYLNDEDEEYRESITGDASLFQMEAMLKRLSNRGSWTLPILRNVLRDTK